MPTYDYRCKTCEAHFEIVQSITAKSLTRCPKKGGPAQCTSPGKGEVAKVFAAPGITFKGEGFYKTDTAQKPKSSTSSTSESSSASDSGGGDSSSNTSTKSGSDKSTTSSSTSNSSSD